MGFQLIPSQNRWANLGSDIGTSLGKVIANRVKENTARKDYEKANNTINDIISNEKTPDATQYASGVAGIDTTVNPLEILGTNSRLWSEKQNEIDSLNNRLSDADEPTKQLLTNQINLATQVQNKLAADSEKVRGILALKNVDLTGYGKDDKANSTWIQQQNNPLLGASDLAGSDPSSTTGLLGINGLQALYDTKKDYNTASTQEDKDQIASRAMAIRNALDKKGINYNSLGLGVDGDGSGYQSTSTPIAQLAPEQLQKYIITNDDLMKNNDIANLAKEKAINYNRDNFNYGDTRNKIISGLMKAGIRPETITAMQGRIDEQAKNIGMRYAMEQPGVNTGDYTNAAKYAIQHGMPTDTLQTFQGIANKYTTNKIDTGGSIVPTAIASNSMGAVPQSGTIGTEYTKTLTPEGQQRVQEFNQTFAFNKDKFNKEYDLQKQQFGDTKALQWAQLQLQSNKLTLDQKEHVAGKIRAGIDVIKTENDNLMKQLVEINKMIMPGQITPAQQSEIDSIKAKINENNANLSKYGAAVDNSLGIENPSPNSKSGKITNEQYDKAYNYLVNVKKYTPEQAEAEIKRIYW